MIALAAAAKRCPHCGRWLPRDRFPSGYCGACHRARTRAAYDRGRVTSRAWRAAQQADERARYRAALTAILALGVTGPAFLRYEIALQALEPVEETADA